MSSEFYGVSRNGRRWQARITIGGKTRCLGTFDSPEAASAVYNRAAEACEEDKPLNKGRGKTQSTASVVRQKVMAFWTEKWDWQLPIIIKETDLETKLGLKKSDNAATICYVFDKICGSKERASKGIAKGVRVLYLKGLTWFDLECMKGLVRVLENFKNVFSVNFGECAFTKLANCSTKTQGIPAWQYLVDNIPRTGLGWIFADKEAGCPAWIVRDLLHCCKAHRVHLQSFGVMEIMPWNDQNVLDALREQRRAYRTSRHIPLDANQRVLQPYMAIGQVLQKGASGKPDQFAMWLQKQEKERGMAAGSIMEQRQAARKTRAVARRGDWDWVYCKCEGARDSCDACRACRSACRPQASGGRRKKA